MPEDDAGAGDRIFASVDETLQALSAHDYLADEGLAAAIYLALSLGRPLFLEGEAGVGKTEVAKVISAMTGGRLLRLQCYEGMTLAQAAYEWDYPRQLLHLRAREAAGGEMESAEDELYDERFLVRRPLLEALEETDGPPPVLLIDEIDRADDEFEALLLEILSESAITIPELGTIRALRPPVVVLTSNRTRDVHDALKRRCLYHWVEHPSFEREVAIVELRAPEASGRLARQVAAAVAELRRLGLYKVPGVAESIDWAAALAVLGADSLDLGFMELSLGAVLKYAEDREEARRAGLEELVSAAVRASG